MRVGLLQYKLAPDTSRMIGSPAYANPRCSRIMDRHGVCPKHIKLHGTLYECVATSNINTRVLSVMQDTPRYSQEQHGL